MKGWQNPKYFRSYLEDFLFDTGIKVVLILLAVVTLYPFWNTIVVSFNDATDTLRGGLTFWPRRWSIQNYKAVFASGTIYNAFLVSVARTVLSTIGNIFLTSMLAYALSRKEYVLRKQYTFVLILSMYVSAGLIPYYFLIRSLGLINSFWVYVVPGLVNAFNFIVIRTYIGTIPDSLVESARIDGAGDFRIFLRIVFPLITPVLATVALFVAVGNWNAWFDTMIFASGRQELSTLQYELMKFLASSQNQARSAADVGAMGMAKDYASSIVTPASIRAAITVVAAAPILIVYPFLQRYFVIGLTVGGVKE
ncbi:MAG: carbohydrate ABC transporter permease [Treponemataceae bacterium]|nr:carbohydrate ABC transporter permease [Treponemataceae bacterium]